MSISTLAYNQRVINKIVEAFGGDGGGGILPPPDDDLVDIQIQPVSPPINPLLFNNSSVFSPLFKYANIRITLQLNLTTLTYPLTIANFIEQDPNKPSTPTLNIVFRALITKTVGFETTYLGIANIIISTTGTIIIMNVEGTLPDEDLLVEIYGLYNRN